MGRKNKVVAKVASGPPPDPSETIKAYLCQDCGHLSEEANPAALYECGNCGTVFNRDNSADQDSNKCPDCNKFSSKLAEECCDSCEQGIVEEVQAVRNADGELEMLEKKHPLETETVPETLEIERMRDLTKHLLTLFYPDWMLHQPWDKVRGNRHDKHANILLREETEEVRVTDLWDVPKGIWKIFLFQAEDSEHCAVVIRFKGIRLDAPKLTEEQKNRLLHRAMGEKDQVRFFATTAEGTEWAHEVWAEERRKLR